jgi:hypothetical protein
MQANYIKLDHFNQRFSNQGLKHGVRGAERRKYIIGEQFIADYEFACMN